MMGRYFMRALVCAALVCSASGFGLTKALPKRSVRPATRRFAAPVMSEGGKKKVLVLGGDGFCGWPTALHLSAAGHDVMIIDNLSRRKIDLDLGCDSLTPISTMDQRVAAWNQVSGRTIEFLNLDIALEYDLLVQLIKQEQPDSVVHFAEQRAAPYSMRTSKTKRYTIDNNLSATHNLLCAIVESEVDVHVVHLGTMGVYGYNTSGGEIPEGYIDVTMPNGEKKSILHPAHPGSIYHATKCLDALLFQFYQKNDQLRVTDLHQGIVWGTTTEQTGRDERLVNRFDYDGDYGTVLNRFLMQAALGVPLTVYGTGGQTRAFIHISDTARCVELAVNNPPESGAPVEIFNQIAQTKRVRDIANILVDQCGATIQNIENPRNEASENELEVSNEKFCNLGLDPIKLESAEGLFAEVRDVASKYADRCIKEKVLPTSYWNKKRAAAASTNTLQLTAEEKEKETA
jgi:UDP-sulfoquinovose synthase